LVTWVKLDDGFADHPKVVGLSDEAFRAFVEGLCYCARQLTDGHIPAAKVKRIAPKGSSVTQLVDGGLWEWNGCGIHVHDYLEYQPSSERIRAKRAADSRRKGGGKP
jgi:hypothetical protein